MCASFKKLTTPSFQDTPPCKEGNYTSIQRWSSVQTLPLERGSTAQRGGGLFAFLLFLFSFFSTHAQVGIPTYPTQEEIDSINAPVAVVDTPIIEPLDLKTVEAELAMLRAKYRKDWEPSISMDNHYTAFFGQTANFWGLKLGVQMFQKYRIGFGGYYMPRFVDKTPTQEFSVRDTITVYRKFRMHYYTTFMEWVFVHNFRWEVALPISAGYGIAEVERWNPARFRWEPGKDVDEFVATVSVNAHYKIFSWVGVGLGLGWRQILTPDQDIQRDFSGLILSYKVKIFAGHLYKALFRKEKILEEKGDYRYQKYLRRNYKRLKREQRK